MVQIKWTEEAENDLNDKVTFRLSILIVNELSFSI